MNQYTNKLARLNTDKSSARWPDFTRHRAPHKPLLLLAVMDPASRPDRFPKPVRSLPAHEPIHQ
jgi:hypothetical protein